METPGEYLSRERELRGVTVEDMAEAMKLSVNTITALERDDHEALPHPTYVKGFVRTYAVYLGIDEDDAVLRYEAYQSDRRTEADKIKKLKEKASRVEVYDAVPAASRMPSVGGKGGEAFAALFGRGRRGNNRTLVAFVAAGILIVVLYFVFAGGRSEPPLVAEAPPGQAGQAGQVASAPVAKKAKESSAKVVKAKKPAPELNKDAAKGSPVAPAVSGTSRALKSSVKGSAPVEKELVLEVIASDTTWMAVEIDGREQREALLQPGETVRWRGAKVFF